MRRAVMIHVGRSCGPPCWSSPGSPSPATIPRRPRAIVYWVNGQLIRSLVSGTPQAGQYAVTWEGTNDLGPRVARGVYIYRRQAAGQVITRKTLLLK